MIGPNSSGLIAASNMTAQPAWQLPMTAGLAVGFGVELDHALEEGGFGVRNVLDRLARYRVREEADEIAGMTGPMATPISLSALKPPMPGPWPARGSTMTKGRFPNRSRRPQAAGSGPNRN